MAELEYKKISGLPQVTNLESNDIFIVNANNVTSKINLQDLASIIISSIDLEGIEEDIATINNAIIQLSNKVDINTTNINNIITSAFNLIGIE